MSRFGYVMVTYFATLGMIVLGLIAPHPRLMWNQTASVPIGLYHLSNPVALKVGDLVVDRPPAALSRYMQSRHYVLAHVPLLKYVGAIADQLVCRHGSVVSVDGLAVATALVRDHANRPLPVWQGCHRLHRGDVFLLNPAAGDSFDGRYFGVLPITTIIARADPIWREHGH